MCTRRERKKTKHFIISQNETEKRARTSYPLSALDNNMFTQKLGWRWVKKIERRYTKY